jgi:hypothetical protein
MIADFANNPPPILRIYFTGFTDKDMFFEVPISENPCNLWSPYQGCCAFQRYFFIGGVIVLQRPNIHTS